MRRIYFFFSLLLFLFNATNLNAVPAKRIWTSLCLSDGRQVRARLIGDELVHYYKTEDGQTIREIGSSGIYEVVKEEDMLAEWKVRSDRRIATRKARRLKNQHVSLTRTVGLPKEQRGLVILVNFADKQMVYDAATYNDFFNKQGYSDYGMTGSVRDYFLSQSYGAFDVEFDVVGPVTVSQNQAYYGQNDAYGNDKYPAEMVIEACKAVDSQMDFSRYDWNGDGEVEQVYVIYAGYGEAQSAPSNTIWPHEYTLDEARLFGDGTGSMLLDGVRVNTYACSCELMGNSGSDIDPIGTACHEFSHCLNLPDTYDPNYYAFGMDQWDLMDAGAYNNNARTPASFTSWERMFCGWLTPTELRTPCEITDMQPITSAPEAYIVYNQENRNEYYLLENRQNEGWDAALRGHGMLVLHVDYDEDVWFKNEVNAKYDHQRLTIIPANNNYRGINVITSKSEYDAAIAGNPYPGTTGNTELTDFSVPASTLFQANTDGRKYMNAPITDITELDGYISLSFGGVYIHVPAPDALQPTDVSADGFTAHWTRVDGAVAYEIVLMGKDTTEVDSVEIEEVSLPVKRASSQSLHRVSDTTCVFSALDASLLYSYQVRALTDEAASEWSNTVDVLLRGQEVSVQSLLKPSASSDVLYDLQGRRILSVHPQPGIYIRNGRKIRIN